MAGFVEVAKVADLAAGNTKVVDDGGQRVVLPNVPCSVFAVDNAGVNVEGAR